MKKKNLTSTKDDDKFKNEDVSYYDDNNSIDEKSFVDDNDDNNINIELKSMTREKIKSSQREKNFKNKIMRVLIRKLLNQLFEKIFRKIIVRRYKIIFKQMIKFDDLLLKNDRKTF